MSTALRRFIESCLDAYYENSHQMGVAVPRAMRVGGVDAAGWSQWKMIPSDVSRAEVAELEGRLPTTLPPAFRALLTTRFVFDLDFGRYSLPSIPSDRRLAEVASTLLDDSTWGAGYLRIGITRDGDPVCLDSRKPTAARDFPVCRFNHDLVPSDAWKMREALAPWATTIAPSFRSFFESLCHGRPLRIRRSRAEREHNRGWQAVFDFLGEHDLPPESIPADLRPLGHAAVLAHLRGLVGA